MRDGLRYALLLIAGLVALLLIVSFTAWGLTTYGSIRHIIGDMAARPDRAADLQSQYDDMALYFNAGSGDTYTFHFRSAPIAVSQAQVSGLSEGDAIGVVLDSYTSGLYNNDLPSGGPGAAGVLFNGAGNQVYFALTIVFLIAFILLVAGTVLLPERPRPANVMSAGKAIAGTGVVAFFVFALLPGLLKSIYWGSVAGIRDILTAIEPEVTGSLLRNTVLLILLAAALYAAGFWMERQSETPLSRAAKKPFTLKLPEIPKVPGLLKIIRAPQQKDKENYKRKGL